MRQLVLLLAAASSAAKVKQLPPKASYYGSETTTTVYSTTTRYPTSTSWYPTTPEETTTDEPRTTSGAACPLGWIDDGNLGCFLFAPQMAGLSWIEALEYCEEQDGFLAEPKTEDQLNFLTSLAYVEEMATGVQGWWVGLADLGHEGEWVWQVDREDADINDWDSGCPDLSEHNSRDCAALISITAKDEEEKQLAARYRDLSCTLPIEEIQVAPICQRGGLSAKAPQKLSPPRKPPQRRLDVLMAGKRTQALVHPQSVSSIPVTDNMPPMQKKTVKLWGDIWLPSTPTRSITSSFKWCQMSTGSEEWTLTTMGSGDGLTALTLTTLTGCQASLAVESTT